MTIKTKTFDCQMKAISVPNQAEFRCSEIGLADRLIDVSARNWLGRKHSLTGEYGELVSAA